MSVLMCALVYVLVSLSLSLRVCVCVLVMCALVRVYMGNLITELDACVNE